MSIEKGPPPDGAEEHAYEIVKSEKTLPRLESDVFCNARARDHSGYCRRRAGFGTRHLGQGRCSLHGGDTPIYSGRYSTLKHERLRELIAKHENDKDPLNLAPEVAALRALFEDFIERYEPLTEALLAWHIEFDLTRAPLPRSIIDAFGRVLEDWRAARLLAASELSDEEQRDYTQAKVYLSILLAGPDISKPRQVMDIADAHKILESVGRMVERIEKIKAQNAITRPELNRVMQEMFRSLEARVKDDVVKQAIIDDWMHIAL